MDRIERIANVITQQAHSQYRSQPGALFASYVIASLPLFILFMFASGTFVKGITNGAFKM